MDTPIWDAALEAAKDRFLPMRFHRWRLKRPQMIDFLILNPDLAEAVYLEALAHQQKASSNNDASNDPPNDSPVSPEN